MYLSLTKAQKTLNDYNIEKQSPIHMSLLKAGIAFGLELYKLAYL